jgi:peptide/nickel transport system substrate-binding protein
MHFTVKQGGKSRRIGNKTRGVIALAVSAGLAIGLVGCGSSTNSASANKTYVEAEQALPPTLDPASFSGGTRSYLITMDSQLVGYAGTSCSAQPNSDKLVGVLAKSWKYSADRKSMTVTLNDYKSQYGNPLTAEDVKWSLDRGRAVSPIVGFLSANSIHLTKTDPITVDSKSKFTFNFDSPTPIDMAMWAVPSFTILDEVAIKKHTTAKDPWGADWLKTHSASFGPWGVSAFAANNTLTMVKNAGYGGTRGNITKVIMKQVASGSDEAQLIQSGAINYARDLTWDQLKSVQSSKKVSVNLCAPISRDWMLLQQKSGPFKSLAVRQAISMALDRSKLAQGAFAGLGTASTAGFLPGYLKGVPGTSKIKDDQVADAKALLATAGYPNGFSFTLGYNASQPGPEVAQLGVLLQSQLKAIGVTVNLDPLTSGNDLQQAESTGTYQALLWSSGSARPSIYFEAGLIEPGSPNNSWGYTATKYVDLVNQLGSATAGSSDYTAAVKGLTNLNVTDVPVVQLVDTPNAFVLSSNVTNLNKALGTIMILPDPSQLNMN